MQRARQKDRKKERNINQQVHSIYSLLLEKDEMKTTNTKNTFLRCETNWYNRGSGAFTWLINYIHFYSMLSPPPYSCMWMCRYIFFAVTRFDFVFISFHFFSSLTFHLRASMGLSCCARSFFSFHHLLSIQNPSCGARCCFSCCFICVVSDFLFFSSSLALASKMLFLLLSLLYLILCSNAFSVNQWMYKKIVKNWYSKQHIE